MSIKSPRETNTMLTMVCFRCSVILGSFSNYLVTKSSAPVMVARKRLRKSKFKNKVQQQVNNLSGPNSRILANAKID